MLEKLKEVRKRSGGDYCCGGDGAERFLGEGKLVGGGGGEKCMCANFSLARQKKTRAEEKLEWWTLQFLHYLKGEGMIVLKGEEKNPCNLTKKHQGDQRVLHEGVGRQVSMNQGGERKAQPFVVVQSFS